MSFLAKKSRIMTKTILRLFYECLDCTRFSQKLLVSFAMPVVK